MYTKKLGKRTRNLFDPLRHGSGQAGGPLAASGVEPFLISRTKIDLFLECPRCFWLDRKAGVARPPGFPFSLNAAVDHLLKKEFDIHRAAGVPHPLMKTYGIKAIPYRHEHLDEWRDNFKGVRFLHKPTNLLVFGAIDDVWASDEGELHVVDYKATSKDTEVTLDAPWQDGYKRQMETYQWLLRQNGFSVSNTGYFVYVNGKRDAKAFDGRLEFDIKIIPYEGDSSWVESTLEKIKKCLLGDLPELNETCEYCDYRKNAREIER